MALSKAESAFVQSSLWAKKRQSELQQLTSGLDLSGAKILNVGANRINLTRDMIGQDVDCILNTDIVGLPNLDCIADATNLPFEDGSFDAVVFLRVLHHIDQFRKALQEALRCTKPGGHILLSEPYKFIVDFQKLTGLDSHPQHIISTEDVEQFVRDNAVEVKKKWPSLFWYYYGYQIRK